MNKNQRKRFTVKINTKVNITQKEITINTLCKQWLFVSKNRVKITTYQKYENVINNHISKHLGNFSAKSITSEIIAKFSDELLKTLSTATVNNVLTILSMILNFAYEQYDIKAGKVIYVKQAKKEMRVLSFEEEKILLDFLSVDVDIYKIAVITALYTGLRIGELCALNWNDINCDTIKVTKTMQRIKTQNGKSQIVILPPKSDSSIRTIPISGSLSNVIEPFRKDDLNFLYQQNGKYIEPRLLQIKFKKILSLCNLEEMNFHCLRHTFSTRCVEAGCDTKTLSELLGHSDVKTTLNRYVHSSFEQKKNCICKFENYIAHN